VPVTLTCSSFSHSLLPRWHYYTGSMFYSRMRGSHSIISDSDRFYSVTLGSVRRSHAPSLPLSSLCGSFCAILSAPLCWLGFWDLLWSQSEGYRTTGETVKGCACSKGNGSWQHGLVCQWPTKLLIPKTEIKSVNYTWGREREPKAKPARERTLDMNETVSEAIENKDRPANDCEIGAVFN